MLLDGILYFWFFLFWKQLFQIKCSYIYSKFKSNSCKNIKRAKLGRKEKFKAQNQLQPHWILCHVIQMSRNSQTTRSSYHFGYLFRIIIGRIIDTSHILIISIRLMLHKNGFFIGWHDLCPLIGYLIIPLLPQQVKFGYQHWPCIVTKSLWAIDFYS